MIPVPLVRRRRAVTVRRATAAVLSTAACVAAAAVTAAAPAQAATTATLSAGVCRPADTPLSTPDSFVVFGLQGDGNLVTRIGGVAAWASGTAGTNADRLCMQTDGNLVAYRGSTATWQSHTAGTGTNNRLSVQTDGNVVVYTAAGKAVWTTATSADTLLPGGKIGPNQHLTSRNNTYSAIMQTDGNLVVRTNSAAIWATATAGHGTSYTTLQNDGNVVVYAGTTATWNAHTNGRGTTRLVMQNDGNLVAYNNTTALWSSKTGPIATDHRAQAAAVASHLLSEWGGKIAGEPQVHDDLVAASQSRAISPCGSPVYLDVRMLTVLDKLATRYNVNLSVIATDHDCDKGWHPKGMAFDVQRMSDPQTGQASELDGTNPSLDGAFLRYLTTIVPRYAGLGQAGCTGRAGTPMPPTVSFFTDTCNHQHVDVTDQSPY